MKAKQNGNSVIVSEINDFNPVHTFECGQCFRWDREPDGSYTGVAFSKPVNISCTGDEIVIKNISLDEYNCQWKNYLDFNTDYNLINNELSTDNVVRPRIKKIVSKLSEMYGRKITFEGKTFYSFPTPNELNGISAADLASLRAGYRADYIVDAVNKVNEGMINLESLKSMDYLSAKKELMKIKGVGPKVADCVLLFSAGKKEAFPIDVWVTRTVRSLYLGENATQKQIENFSRDHFGNFAGVAQQYLFYYGRENKI